MSDHLLDHVRLYLDRDPAERIAYVRAPRWIAHQVAKDAHRRLADLLSRPASLRTQGLMLVGPYANGKTMIAERFAVEHLRTASKQKVWIVQTREGAGLGHSMQAFFKHYGRRSATAAWLERVRKSITCWPASNRRC